MQRFLACALVVANLSFGSVSLGQSADNKAAAEALYEEGKALMQEGRFLDAATKFQASNRLDSGIGTIMYMADAFEQAGKLASAWANWREAQALANQANQTARSEIAKQRADALEPRLTKVRIDVGKNAGLDGFKLKRGNTEVTKEIFGVATPVDPGTYAVTATAPGRFSWKSSITTAKEGGVVSLTVPLLNKDPNAKSASKPAQADNKVSSASADRASGSGSSSLAYKATAISLGGLGAIGLGLGTYFALQAKSEFDEANTRCNETSCFDALASEQTGRALTQSHLATVSFVSGGAAIGAGLLVWLLAPSNNQAKNSDQASFCITPSIASDHGGITVGGTW